jgi:hypothetical protein
MITSVAASFHVLSPSYFLGAAFITSTPTRSVLLSPQLDYSYYHLYLTSRNLNMPVALAGDTLHNPGIIHLTIETLPVRSYHIDTEVHHFSVAQDAGEYFDAVIGFYPRPPDFLEITPEQMVNVRIHLTGARQMIVTLNEEVFYMFDYIGMSLHRGEGVEC